MSPLNEFSDDDHRAHFAIRILTRHDPKNPTDRSWGCIIRPISRFARVHGAQDDDSWRTHQRYLASQGR